MKRILQVIIIILCALAAAGLAACGKGGGKKDKITAPSLDYIEIKTANNVKQKFAAGDDPICLADNNFVVDISIYFDNPSKLTIASVYLDNTKYTSGQFAEGSDYAKITLEKYTLTAGNGEGSLVLDRIVYNTTTATPTLAATLTAPILVKPVFKLTMDLSECRREDGTDKTVTVNNVFGARLALPIDSIMNNIDEETGRGTIGMAFAGWYSEENGGGAKYDTSTLYTFRHNVTLYAHYERPFTYTIKTETTTDPATGETVEVAYATVTGLTQFGQTQYRITLPEAVEGATVAKIGASAFSKVAASATVLLSSTIKEIGAKAFQGKSGIFVNLQNVEKIGDYAFDGCGAIQGVNELSPNLKYIGAYAFQGCVWDTVTPHPDYPNLNYSSPSTLLIPASVEYIGPSAFAKSGFKKIRFMEGVELDAETIGESVFAGSASLTSVYTGVKFAPVGEFDTRASLTTTGVENGLKYIPVKGFYDCVKLSNVETADEGLAFSEGLYRIEESAFSSKSSGTVNLQFVNFPQSLQYIGKNAFANTQLKNITFHPETTSLSLAEYCFQNSKITSVYIYGLISYDRTAFYGNLKLTEIFISSASAADYIQTSLIMGTGLSNYAKVFVPSTLVGSYKLKWVKKISEEEDMVILDRDKIIETLNGGKYAYEYVDLEAKTIKITNVFSLEADITIPESVEIGGVVYTVVSVGAFCTNDQVTKLRLPTSLTEIADKAFFRVSGLNDVEWYKSGSTPFNIYDERAKEETFLTKIGAQAFFATGITGFVGSETLTNIGEGAFSTCKIMTTVKLVGWSELTIGSNAFKNCDILQEVWLIGNSSKLGLYDGCFSYNNALNAFYFYVIVDVGSESNMPKFLGLGTDPFMGDENITFYVPTVSLNFLTSTKYYYVIEDGKSVKKNNHFKDDDGDYEIAGYDFSAYM